MLTGWQLCVILVLCNGIEQWQWSGLINCCYQHCKSTVYQHWHVDKLAIQLACCVHWLMACVQWGLSLYRMSENKCHSLTRWSKYAYNNTWNVSSINLLMIAKSVTCSRTTYGPLRISVCLCLSLCVSDCVYVWAYCIWQKWRPNPNPKTSPSLPLSLSNTVSCVCVQGPSRRSSADGRLHWRLPTYRQHQPVVGRLQPSTEWQECSY